MRRKRYQRLQVEKRKNKSLEDIFHHHTQLSSTFFTVNLMFYVGGSDTASQFHRSSASDFKQHFGTE